MSGPIKFIWHIRPCRCCFLLSSQVKRTRAPGLTPNLLKSSAAGLEDVQTDAKLPGDETGRHAHVNDSKAVQGFTAGYSCNDTYSVNAVTAVLCRDHPNCMADFVKMFEDHYSVFESLSKVGWIKAPTHKDRALQGKDTRWNIFLSQRFLDTLSRGAATMHRLHSDATVQWPCSGHCMAVLTQAHMWYQAWLPQPLPSACHLHCHLPAC